MFPVRVKICGIKSADEAGIAVSAGVNALGFVFADSPRRLTPDQAMTIIKGIPPFVTKVGVFVNEDAGHVQDIAKRCGLDTLQFHGEETPEYCRRFPRHNIIKAVPIANDNKAITQKDLRFYDVDALLLDTYYPHKKGGGGKTFNWDAVCSIKDQQNIQIPVILAGGLRPENIIAALNSVQPFGVDVSSGVELNGRKDPDKVKRLMSQVHAWNERYFLETRNFGGEKGERHKEKEC